MSQMGFYYSFDTCTGCKTCQVACKDVNNLDPGMQFREVHEIEAGTFPDPKAFFVSMSCNHCEHPGCVANCPTGAMFKDEETGIVHHDDEKCIGCRMCVLSCPYGAPKYSEELKIVQKCQFCVGSVESDEDPACVASCQMRAIEYGDIDELRAKHGTLADTVSLPDSSLTSPSITITPHRSVV